jgi:hypothetical protein
MAQDDRFIRIYAKGIATVNEIWVDRETGVNYYFHAAGYSGRALAAARPGKGNRRDRRLYARTHLRPLTPPATTLRKGMADVFPFILRGAIPA